ncbi:MAG: SIMPL domain-containing protein [Gillisia sp.]
MKKLKCLLVVLSVLLITSAANAQSGIQPSPSPTVSVTGEGVVKVQPDQVIIKSRIETDGKDAQTVKKQNDATVDKVIKYLKKEGVAEKNIHTDYINLNKNYNYDDKTYSYVANQAISITLENLKNYEEIMSGLLEAGLNRIDGVEFKSSAIDTYKTQARKKAVLDAQTKATEFVTPLNQEIGKAVSINEVESNNYTPVYRMSEMKASADTGGQETIAPGEMEVRVKVNVSFELK